jgi:hypothetical protein
MIKGRRREGNKANKTDKDKSTVVKFFLNRFPKQTSCEDKNYRFKI